MIKHYMQIGICGDLLRHGPLPLPPIPADGTLAILWVRHDTGGIRGTIIHHGEAKSVRAFRDHARKAILDMDVPWLAQEYELIAIPVASLTQALVEEINDAFACPGKIAVFAQRLEAGLAGTAAAA